MVIARVRSNSMGSEEISFGRFRLDLGRRELRRDGEPLRLHRHALGILCALAEAKGEIVSKDELLARLWRGRIVEEGNLHVRTYQPSESRWTNAARSTVLS